MKPRLSITTMVVLLLATVVSAVRQASPDTAVQPQEKAAQLASNSWLALVDSGKFDESWTQASDGLKGLTKREDFIASVQTARNRVGKLLVRKLKTSKYTTKLQG